MGIARTTGKQGTRFSVIVIRTLLGLALVLSVLWLPIWVTGAIALIDGLFFGAWPEIIILGSLLDIVFYSGSFSLGSTRHTLWAVSISAVTYVARRQTRFLYDFS